MSKDDIQVTTIDNFFYWINERHRIFKRRKAGEEKPWSEDPIFRKYKFTNVFRQLDTGTIALNEMLGDWHNCPMPLKDMELDDAIDVLFNIVWYRLYNHYEHAKDIGFTNHEDHQKIYDILSQKKLNGEKVFTSAHMTSGTGDVIAEHGKIYGHMVGPIGIAEEFGERMISAIYHNQTLEYVTNMLRHIPMIGKFIAYEITCDLCFTPLLSAATDRLTWANIGPGAHRGMRRLGKVPSVEVMVELYNLAIDEEMVEYHVAEHFPFNEGDPPFELREIEHSLCEFDKYMRVKTGVGRPRQKYDGE